MLKSKESVELNDKIAISTVGLTSKCWDIGQGLKTFALDLNGFPRDLTWEDLVFMRDQAKDLMRCYFEISEIIEAQDNLRRQNLTKTEN